MGTTVYRLAICCVVLLAVSVAPSRGEEPAAWPSGQPGPERATLPAMAGAARLFVASLSDAQRGQAVFALDSAERTNLRLAPLPPWGGVPIGGLDLEQQVLLHLLLSASLSSQGFAKATQIMALEDYLVELERAAGQNVPVHGIERYTVALFGDPAPPGPGPATWGWRLQGHHLSLNFLVVDGKIYGAAPSFYGAQPHRVAEGERAGWHVLGDEERLGRELLQSLDPGQRRTAVIAETMPGDMFAGNRPGYGFAGEQAGLAVAAMNDAQRARLRALVEHHGANVPADERARRRALVERGGWEAARFVWIGSEQPGERMYYRVAGPEFLIEYCAVAQSPNHVHTIWREKHGDFGADVLGDHMRAAHSGR